VILRVDDRETALKGFLIKDYSVPGGDDVESGSTRPRRPTGLRRAFAPFSIAAPVSAGQEHSRWLCS